MRIGSILGSRLIVRPPTLTAIAAGCQLLTGSSAVGLAVTPALAGTYTAQVSDTLGSPAPVEISITRTIAVE